ncbi:MAG: radical SAM protein [Syntrophorhabdaceae bacterium]|nr:radical SAM protein [Syntrophorhabdaceae bacterium]
MRGDEFFRQLAAREPFAGLHPSVGAFFREYLSREKAVSFDGRFVVNAHFPPFPGGAFDNLAEHFGALGERGNRRLYSVTLGVTNRCRYRCWHCYNAGRKQRDLSLRNVEKIARQLSGLGSVMVTLSGGEPLLRRDLEDIVGFFDSRSCLMLNTTGSGLTEDRARRLKEKGLFAIGVSLDSMNSEEHDRKRGRRGAFRTALRALHTASESGLYPYVVTVASREILKPDNFMRFIEFAGRSRAREVHLLEPCPTGRLSGRGDVVLDPAGRKLILDYQHEVAAREDLPILSTFLYLESQNAFGCGAGLTYLYIDGSGEVCPCNLIPLSFGNAVREPLTAILERMGRHFAKPRASCVGHILAGHIPEGPIPAPPEISEKVCGEHLPRRHRLPRFFTVKRGATASVGSAELRHAYDRICCDYDRHWLSEAGKPVRKLVEKLTPGGAMRIFEAGCGSGYATALLAEGFGPSCGITAADISREMIGVARKRIRAAGHGNVRFFQGDALRALRRRGPFDLVFTSWVLGYIPLQPFFETTAASLDEGGRLAFIVHRQNSPARELGIFRELVAEDPSVLKKRIHFDFPEGRSQVERLLERTGLLPEEISESRIVFRCASPEGVLEHLIGSGAGTAFYDALDPVRRQDMEARFKKVLSGGGSGQGVYDVVHEFVLCVARKAA